MALFQLGKLAVIQLLLTSTTSASYNQVSKGVVRIELAKHFIPHHEIEELEESADMDGQIHIEIDDTSYA